MGQIETDEIYVGIDRRGAQPVAAQFIEDNLIALFSFEEEDNGIVISAEKHYRLLIPERVTDEDLATYRQRGF